MIENSNTSEEGRIKRNRKTEGHMKKLIVRGIFAATIALTALGVRPVIASAEHVSVQSSPTTFTNADPGTCDPITFAPKTGQLFCIESLTGTNTLTGDFVGTDLIEVSVLVYADGSSNFTDYESWTGTVTGHGTGSFILLETDGILHADGSATTKVRIVNGTGTGDLAGITGRGSFSTATGAEVTTMTLEFPGQH
jgi:hypothetical protein